MISDDRLHKALTYLAETDAPYAEARGQLLRCEHAAKLARARMYLLSDRKSVEDRKADAEVSADVRDADAQVADQTVTVEALRAKRTTEVTIVEVWRSLQANRRVGNV